MRLSLLHGLFLILIFGIAIVVVYGPATILIFVIIIFAVCGPLCTPCSSTRPRRSIGGAAKFSERSTSTTKSAGVLTITTHRRQRRLLAYMGDVQGHLEAGSLKYLARRMHL